jgi:hypothetical protein
MNFCFPHKSLRPSAPPLQCGFDVLKPGENLTQVIEDHGVRIFRIDPDRGSCRFDLLQDIAQFLLCLAQGIIGNHILPPSGIIGHRHVRGRLIGPGPGKRRKLPLQGILNELLDLLAEILG